MSPGKDEATRLAAAKEFTEAAAAIAAAECKEDVGGGGGGGKHVGNDVAILRFRPMGLSPSDGRLLLVNSGGGKLPKPAPNLRKSKGCMFCNLFSGDELFKGLVLMLLGGELVVGGPLTVGILRKLRGCFWCGDMVGRRDG